MLIAAGKLLKELSANAEEDLRKSFMKRSNVFGTEAGLNESLSWSFVLNFSKFSIEPDKEEDSGESVFMFMFVTRVWDFDTGSVEVVFRLVISSMLTVKLFLNKGDDGLELQIGSPLLKIQLRVEN